MLYCSCCLLFLQHRINITWSKVFLSFSVFSVLISFNLSFMFVRSLAGNPHGMMFVHIKLYYEVEHLFVGILLCKYLFMKNIFQPCTIAEKLHHHHLYGRPSGKSKSNISLINSLGSPLMIVFYPNDNFNLFSPPTNAFDLFARRA